MGYSDPSIQELVGQKVIQVEGSTLYLETGKAWTVDLDGECCSTSEFTPDGLAAFRELVGATITAAEDRNNETEDLVAREAKCVEKYGVEEVDIWHFLVFTTDKGHVTIDWRNISNGYYDGSCFLVAATPLEPWRHDAALLGREAP